MGVSVTKKISYSTQVSVLGYTVMKNPSYLYWGKIPIDKYEVLFWKQRGDDKGYGLRNKIPNNSPQSSNYFCQCTPSSSKCFSSFIFHLLQPSFGVDFLYIKHRSRGWFWVGFKVCQPDDVLGARLKIERTVLGITGCLHSIEIFANFSSTLHSCSLSAPWCATTIAWWESRYYPRERSARGWPGTALYSFVKNNMKFPSMHKHRHQQWPKLQEETFPRLLDIKGNGVSNSVEGYFKPIHKAFESWELFLESFLWNHFWKLRRKNSNEEHNRKLLEILSTGKLSWFTHYFS